MTVVGRIAGLWRYPVKSMAAERLDEIEVSWHGLAGDRRWAFIRDGQARSGFPWLTIRERPEMARYQPRFAEPDRPNGSLTLVRTPSGDELDAADPALAAELGPGVRVIKQDRGVFDTMPLSLLTTQTLAGLGRLAGADLAAGRFRPNLLVEAASGPGFPEDTWVGRVLRCGLGPCGVERRSCVTIPLLTAECGQAMHDARSPSRREAQRSRHRELQAPRCDPVGRCTARDNRAVISLKRRPDVNRSRAPRTDDHPVRGGGSQHLATQAVPLHLGARHFDDQSRPGRSSAYLDRRLQLKSQRAQRH